MFQPSPMRSRLNSIIAAELIVFVALITYGNTLTGPFVFDDYSSIILNSTLHHPWNIAHWLSPSPELPVGGRPMLNLSFVLNYAIGGTEVVSYHVVNLGIHVLAALTLYGITRRTLLQPGLGDRFGRQAESFALAVALLWVVHPLQTDAVTYIAERAESLMAMFYLLTLYCYIRASEPGAPTRRWSALCVASGLAGVGTKEVMVTAPLIVLLYDRAFVAGSFRAAWRQRRPLLLSLAGTWVLLGFLMHHLSARGVGLSLGSSPWDYALTECWAVTHYLRLAVWPHPLVIDYGPAVITRAASVWPQALLLVLLVGAALLAAFRRTPWGFLALAFFLILAPTSTFIPIIHEPIAEHRMYLPLACLIPLVVAALGAACGRAGPWAVGGLVLAWAAVAWERNGDYHTAVSLWSETVAARPSNPRAHTGLGQALLEAARLPEAQAQLEEAIRINSLQAAPPPRPAEVARAHDVLGVLLAREGRTDAALAEFHRALQLHPADSPTHFNLGHLLARLGRTAEAIPEFQEALRLRPDFPEAQAELAKLPAVR